MSCGAIWCRAKVIIVLVVVVRDGDLANMLCWWGMEEDRDLGLKEDTRS